MLIDLNEKVTLSFVKTVTLRVAMISEAVPAYQIIVAGIPGCVGSIVYCLTTDS